MKKYIRLLFTFAFFAQSFNLFGQLTQYCIGTANNEIATKICYIPSDSSAIIGGYTYDYVSGTVFNCQAILLKVTNSGLIAWQKTFGIPSSNNLIQDMIITDDTNIVIVGVVGRGSTPSTNNVAAILKFNSTTGNLMWQKCIQDAATTAGGEIFLGVTQLTDGTGRLVAVGAHNYTSTGADGMICMFQPDGTFIYSEILGVPNGDEFESVTTSTAGNSVYICGEYDGDYKDGRVIRYTPGTTSGTVGWSQYFDFYLFGTLQGNYFSKIHLSGSTLVIGGACEQDYTTTGGTGQFVMTLNAADGTGAQIYGLRNGGAMYSNAPTIAVVSSDHIFAVQSPSTSVYDPVYWITGVSTDAEITEITSLTAGTANPPVKFTTTAVGQHSILDIQVQDSTLFLTGSTNITSGFGNNDIYYVVTGASFSSNNHTCDTAHDAIAITNPSYTSTSPAYTDASFTPTYISVDTATIHFNIKVVCGDNVIPLPGCNTLTLTDSLHVCKNTTVTLPAAISGTDSILSIAWVPSAELSDSSILTPTLTADASGMYYLSVQSLLPVNLVVNGDFSGGNTGFTSAFPYVSGPGSLVPAGVYAISTDPNDENPAATSFGDHTTGTGNMMAISGASAPVDVWCETVFVTPNTWYDFSAWFANWSSDTSTGLPIIQFEINGALTGTTFTFPHPDGLWTQFNTTWYSGTSTTASICINDQQTTSFGNDFAIDDISFQQICITEDSIYVAVRVHDTTTSSIDTLLCVTSSPLTLTAPAGYTSYLWNNGDTTTSISAATSGDYWVYNNNFCATITDTFKVAFFPLPVLSLGSDTSFCIGDTIDLSSIQPAGTTYLWSTGSTSDSIHVSSSGTYWLQISNSCVVVDSIHVTVSPIPIVNLGPDTTNCNGDSVTIQSSVTYISPIYLWSTGSSAPLITTDTTGLFWLTVTVGGCAATDTVNVAIVYDTFRLGNKDTAICRGKSVQAMLSANAAATFQWLPTAGIPASATSSPLITPDTPAMYSVHIYLPGCPDLIDSFYIDVQPNPVVYIGGNRFVCYYDTLHLVASVTPQWYTHYIYRWSPGTYLDDSTTSAVVFTPGDSSTISLIVTTPTGCESEDSAQLIVHPNNFASLDTSFNLCPGDSVQLLPKGGVSYVWHPGLYLSDSTSTDPWVYAITSLDYIGIAKSQYGCLDTVNATVFIRANGVIYLGDSVTLYPGESYQISPQSNCLTFEWFPPAGLSSSTIINPLATPEISTKYIVHGVTEWGCVAIDSIDIYVDPETLLVLPNAFTPGAGVNSILLLIKRGEATLNYFRIFNRWGNKVFETTDIDAGWDGTYHGAPQPFDVYVYQVEATTNTGRIFYKSGNVTLIR